MKIWLMPFHARYLRLQTHTLGVCNTNFFSTAITFAQRHISVALYVHRVSCSFEEELKDDQKCILVFM